MLRNGKLAAPGPEVFLALGTINQWLAEHLPEGARLGFFGATMMVKAVADIEEKLKSKRISVQTEHDLVDAVWTDRPDFPMAPVFAHAMAYAGESAKDKLNRVRDQMRKLDAQAHVLNALDDIGYLLNLRGTDVSTSPYFHAYLVVTQQSAILYAHLPRFSADLVQSLKEQGVELKPYDIFFVDLKALSGQAVLVDPAQSNLLTFKQLRSFNCRLIEKRAPSIAMKAVKNSVELDNWKNCFVRDGVAMVHFLNWFHKHVGLEPALSSSPRAHSSRSWGGNRNYLQNRWRLWACGAVASVVSPSTWALQRAARSLSARWRMCFAGGMIAFSQPMLCGMKRLDCKRMLLRRRRSSSSRRMQSWSNILLSCWSHKVRVR
jgi:hypothetical protein